MEPLLPDEGADAPGFAAAHPALPGASPLPEYLLPGEDEAIVDPGDHLWLHDDGRLWDLGPPDLDTDADGVAESLTRSGPGGLTVYTDADLDGQVDRVTEVGADGSYRAQLLDEATGTWRPTDTGRIG
ncbi:MAG: hypothetical protein QM662_10275 [Gordonia sp. (in: high G+C Gram-positive bacteria)]